LSIILPIAKKAEQHFLTFCPVGRLWYLSCMSNQVVSIQWNMCCTSVRQKGLRSNAHSPNLRKLKSLDLRPSCLKMNLQLADCNVFFLVAPKAQECWISLKRFSGLGFFQNPVSILHLDILYPMGPTKWHIYIQNTNLGVLVGSSWTAVTTEDLLFINKTTQKWVET
jgi:hypothetical protein